MRVRPATRDDLVAVRRVADAAYWDSYAGLLKPETVGRFLEAAYSPAALRRRLLAGGLRVAEWEDQIVGFVDAEKSEAATIVGDVSTEPRFRRHGVGRALVEVARVTEPERPVRADVVLGNIDGERFFEALGFVPGEVMATTLHDEEIVERRWWLSSEPAG
ncbi:MAG TPA: GNAT family N-acetyltransferase [Acidimicrobiia bacterium]|nr:GNAT family N-acetyltransferase [Acidimicrobiia bacterium]